MVAAPGIAWAQQDPSRLSTVLDADASKDAPEPYVPLIREPPPGSELRPWKTWTTNQDIDFLPRITIQLGGGMSFPCGGTAESTKNRFDYPNIWRQSRAIVLDLALNLTPNMAVGFRGVLSPTPESEKQDILANDVWSTGSFEGSYFAKFGAFLFTITLKCPLVAGASSFIDFGSSENWQGFAPFLKLGAGIATIEGQDISWSSGSSGEMPDAFIQSRTLGWTASAGAELRAWHLSVVIECGVVDFGKPEPVRETDYGLGVFTRLDRVLRAIAIGSLSISF
jgi:hypothetical protein